MPSNHSRRSSLPSNWNEVLDRVLQGLEQAITAAAQREQALAEGPPAVPSSLVDHPPLPGERLQALLHQTEQQAAQVEADLEAGAEASRQWLEMAHQLRRRLVKEPGRSL